MRNKLNKKALLSLFVLYLAGRTVYGAPPLQHAAPYTGQEDVTGWYMSEKLDGIRGYWTGTRLVTRKGRPIHAPKWFLAHFPPFALDGELWRKRNDFNFVQKTVMDHTPSGQWRQISYNIFEVPDAPGDFPVRLEKAMNWFKTHPCGHVRIIKQHVCRGPAALADFLHEVESRGGEGVMVKNPHSPYEPGRTSEILKVKYYQDMEGVVTGHNPGKGKFKNMMGSLTIRLANSTMFRLGSGFTVADRKNPPPVGAVVTFRYRGMTANGIPRFASFLRVRMD